jgi:hypothetical protein
MSQAPSAYFEPRHKFFLKYLPSSSPICISPSSFSFFGLGLLYLSPCLCHLDTAKMYRGTMIHLFLDLIICAQAGPAQMHHKRGQLPLSVSGVEFLGDVRSLTTHVKRDLGFQGKIGEHVLLTYGDTMYSDANYTDMWRGMTSDSMAYATHNPLEVLDVGLNEQGYPGQFCPVEAAYGEEAAQCAMGITNVVETYPGQGNSQNPAPSQSLTRLT